MASAMARHDSFVAGESNRIGQSQEKLGSGAARCARHFHWSLAFPVRLLTFDTKEVFDSLPRRHCVRDSPERIPLPSIREEPDELGDTTRVDLSSHLPSRRGHVDQDDPLDTMAFMLTEGFRK